MDYSTTSAAALNSQCYNWWMGGREVGVVFVAETFPRRKVESTVVSRDPRRAATMGPSSCYGEHKHGQSTLDVFQVVSTFPEHMLGTD